MPARKVIAADMGQVIASMVDDPTVGGGYSPGQIYSALLQDERFKSRQFSLRTIERFVKELLPPDPSGLWMLADSEPEDARIVLGMLGWIVSVSLEDTSDSFDVLDARWMARGDSGENESALLEQLKGTWPDKDNPPPTRRLTREEAAWIVHLVKVAPTLWPDWPLLLYSLALQYRRTPERLTLHLDTFVAMHPWENPECARRYKMALMADARRYARTSSAAAVQFLWLQQTVNGTIKEGHDWRALGEAPPSNDTGGTDGTR